MVVRATAQKTSSTTETDVSAAQRRAEQQVDLLVKQLLPVLQQPLREAARYALVTLGDETSAKAWLAPRLRIPVDELVKELTELDARGGVFALATAVVETTSVEAREVEAKSAEIQEKSAETDKVEARGGESKSADAESADAEIAEAREIVEKSVEPTGVEAREVEPREVEPESAQSEKKGSQPPISAVRRPEAEPPRPITLAPRPSTFRPSVPRPSTSRPSVPRPSTSRASVAPGARPSTSPAAISPVSAGASAQRADKESPLSPAAARSPAGAVAPAGALRQDAEEARLQGDTAKEAPASPAPDLDSLFPSLASPSPQARRADAPSRIPPPPPAPARTPTAPGVEATPGPRQSSLPPVRNSSAPPPPSRRSRELETLIPPVGEQEKDLFLPYERRLQALSYAESSQEAATLLLEMIVDAVPCRAGLIHRYDKGSACFIVESAHGDKASALEAFETPETDPVVRATLAQKTPLHLAPASNNELLTKGRFALLGPKRAVACVSGTRRDQPVGLIELVDPLEGAEFSRAQLTALGDFFAVYAKVVAQKFV